MAKGRLAALFAAATLLAVGMFGCACSGASSASASASAASTSAPAQESEPAAPAQTSIIRENGYPNFEVILQGDRMESWESRLSSLPATQYTSSYASNDGAAARFSHVAGELGLKEGEWALDLSNYGASLWLNPGDAVFDDAKMAALIAEATGATWVGVAEEDGVMIYEAGDSFYGTAMYSQYEDEGNFLDISVHKGAFYQEHPDGKGVIIAEYTF